MRAAQKNRLRPCAERMEGRGLMTAGVSASLSRGVLSVVSQSAAAPIVVDVAATRGRGGVQGVVVVEGVGVYNARQVRAVVISGLVGEPMAFRPSPRWDPALRVITRPAPTTITSLPTFPVTAPVHTAPPTVPVTPPTAPVTTPTAPVTTPTAPVTPPTVTTPGAPNLAVMEQQIVAAVNQQRALNGLAPLTVNPKLVAAATLQATIMAKLSLMAHDIPNSPYPHLADRANAAGYKWTTLGENVAMGYLDVPSVMAAWMNSPPHRASILGSSYTETGVAVAYDASGTPYYSEVFGSPA